MMADKPDNEINVLLVSADYTFEDDADDNQSVILPGVYPSITDDLVMTFDRATGKLIRIVRENK